MTERFRRWASLGIWLVAAIAAIAAIIIRASPIRGSALCTAIRGRSLIGTARFCTGRCTAVQRSRVDSP